MGEVPAVNYKIPTLDKHVQLITIYTLMRLGSTKVIKTIIGPDATLARTLYHTIVFFFLH